MNHLVPPSPHIEHFLRFQTMASTNTFLLGVFSIWSAHHQMNDWSEVSLHEVSSFYQEYKTLSTGYSPCPFPRSGPPLDLSCYVARAFHVQHAIATCPIFFPFFSYSTSDPSTPVWTTSHAKNMFASPASLLWVNPFTVLLNTLHDAFYTLHNPTSSRCVLLIDASLDEYTSCVTDFLRMNPSFGYFVGHKSNARPRIWEHNGVTMLVCRPVLCFFLQNARAQTADPIHYHDVVRTRGHFLQRSVRDKLSISPRGLFLSNSAHS